MMIENRRQQIINQVSSDLKGYKTGYFATLNALTDDEIRHEAKLRKLMYWLGSYCYGRQFKRDEIILKTVSVNEIGTVNQGLHSHILIMHNNDTSRTFEQLDQYIKRKWYLLLNANQKNHKFSSLVDLKVVHDVEGCLGYMTKTMNYLPHGFNLQYL